MVGGGWLVVGCGWVGVGGRRREDGRWEGRRREGEEGWKGIEEGVGGRVEGGRGRKGGGCLRLALRI